MQYFNIPEFHYQQPNDLPSLGLSLMYSCETTPNWHSRAGHRARRYWSARWPTLRQNGAVSFLDQTGRFSPRGDAPIPNPQLRLPVQRRSTSLARRGRSILPKPRQIQRHGPHSDSASTTQDSALFLNQHQKGGHHGIYNG